MKVSLPNISIRPASGSTAIHHHFLMMTESITIPDGNRATIHEMVAAQQSIQEFVVTAEARLNDVEDAMLHDFVVDQLRELANQYNQQLQFFTARHANH